MSDPTPEQERGPRRVYANETIEVQWEPKLCIHVRHCVRGLPQVFDPDTRPWVIVDAASADQVAEAVLTCPTGALHFRRLDGGPQEAAAEPPTVEPRPNGPRSFAATCGSSIRTEGSSARTRGSRCAAAALPGTSRSATEATAGSASRLDKLTAYV
jgi:uncharacterized Fe-S cluster protein YjdI